MLPQQYCLRWKYHHSNLQTMFSQLLDRGCFCDVTLACEGQLIRAHRVVLCACSTFFDTVLTNYASERDPIIIMKDVTFANVKCLIEFMYKGEINVEYSHLASLLKTADDLKIKGLAEVSWREDEDMVPPAIPIAEYSHNRSSPPVCEKDRNSASLKAGSAQIRMPTLTPISSLGNSISISSSPVDYYLGPKRKRGRPPLDDSYDVFNVRKYVHSSTSLEYQPHLETPHLDEHKQSSSKELTSLSVATSAYQQHIQQHQKKRILYRTSQSECEEGENGDQPDPEWINSNLEVNVGECEETKINENENMDDKNLRQNVETEQKHSKKLKNRDKSVEHKEKISKDRVSRKNSIEINDSIEPMECMVTIKSSISDSENCKEAGDESFPQEAVHEVKDLEHVLETEITTPNSGSPSSHPSPSFTTTKHSTQYLPPPPPPPPPPPHHAQYGKFGPESYVVNEHSILMANEFVHSAVTSLPASKVGSPNSATTANCNTIANGGDTEFADIKIEDYDVADLRLTSEEITQWQDVIKMDDYLAKGRRPQFWEEPFTRRVLDAIKNKRLEMKKAARILGVSYGTLYGRYREVYGCLKHPYSGATVRPPGTNQLNVQPRYDIVWPTAKRDVPLLPGQTEIEKILPKDLSDLWTRPQI